MKATILFMIALSMGYISCNSDTTGQYTYRPPDNMLDGIDVGSLNDVNIDKKLIEKAVGKIWEGRFTEVHSLLIFKDNKLVLEEYFQGHEYQWDAPGYHGKMVQWNVDMMHHNMSCTKSFTSACIGIAIEKGYIQNVHQSIFDYLPDHQQFKTGGKEYITIEHLLTMTSGLAWNEWGAAHGTSANDIDRIYFECSDDPIKCVLERELVSTPGEEFTYNGGGIIILGEILKNATNTNLYDFSMKNLFGPLGIDSIYWYQYENGVYAADGSLYLTPRDMLKFGVTYLYNGRWNGQRILPEYWIAKSSEVYNNNQGIRIPLEDLGKVGYGYTWWTKKFSASGREINMFWANGWGGQKIIVIPELDTVVVFTAGNFASKGKEFKILKNYIIPAIQ
jgi:CubicO group peptidase (beta-lactamase class C family)